MNLYQRSQRRDYQILKTNKFHAFVIMLNATDYWMSPKTHIELQATIAILKSMFMQFKVILEAFMRQTDLAVTSV